MGRYPLLLLTASANAIVPIPKPENIMPKIPNPTVIPSGDWHVSSIGFALVQIDVEDAVWDWAQQLP